MPNTMDRRNDVRGRRKDDNPVAKRAWSYPTLNEDVSLLSEDLSVGGRPVCVPASFGADGRDHYLGHLRLSGEGRVTAFSH